MTRFRRSLDRFATLALLAFLLAQGAAPLHLLTVRHATGAAGGEALDVRPSAVSSAVSLVDASGDAADVALAPETGPQIGAASRNAAAETHACALGLLLRERPARTPLAAVAAFTLPAAPRLTSPAPALAPRARALLRLAPKHSPPVA